MSAVVVIPARGGSKGIPRKNLQRVGGVPLVLRAVRTALAAPSVSTVVVSTDDPEIAVLAAQGGAKVVARPEDLSGDTASSESAVLHALEQVIGDEGRPAVTVLMQCTSPATLPEDVEACIQRVLGVGDDCAFTASVNHRFLWREGAQGLLGVNHDAALRLPRQQLAPEYVETGAVYAMATEGFLTARHRFFGRVGCHVVPADRAYEIDDDADLLVCQALTLHHDAQDRYRPLPRRTSGVVMDFDGVLTDDLVLTGQNGQEGVTCSRSDGMGIALLREAGVQLLVLSKERNPVVTARCQKLGVEVRQAVDDKVPALMTWMAEKGLDAADVVFLGNDVNDAGCLTVVGCPVVVADAHPSVHPLARIVLTKPGGKGAVRELADAILSLR